MISTSHLLIGTAAGAATGNPIGAFFVGMASHLVADFIPHTDLGDFGDRKDLPGESLHFKTSDYIEAFTDILVGGAAVLFFMLKSPMPDAFNMFFGAAGGLSIDMIDNVPFWSVYIRKLPFFRTLHWVHEKIHNFHIKDFKAGKYWYIGIPTQILAIGFSIFYLVKFSGII